MDKTTPENHLDVYTNRYELHQDDKVSTYMEGPQSEEAKKRYNYIRKTLKEGYLDQKIRDLCPEAFSDLSDANKALLQRLVDKITSNEGRGLVSMTFLQLTIKSIAPEQSIRLHKGSSNRSAFSWVEGISMRSLDKSFNTKFLRNNGLLNLNNDGAVMTRTLAENYPYSRLYKANMKGPFAEWIAIVDAVESGEMPAEKGLLYLMSLLKNRSDQFKTLADQTIEAASAKQFLSFEDAVTFMETFFDSTAYSARAFEVTIHSFMQAMVECGYMGDLELVPISQMRSANKKHGNIGDIELTEDQIIVESWDAKYGKPYLRDELEELRDKILATSGVRIAGFIANKGVDRREDITDRAEEISVETNAKIELYDFAEWLSMQTRGLNEDEKLRLAPKWLMALVESFAQRRLSIAPIDEPCDGWLADLFRMLK